MLTFSECVTHFLPSAVYVHRINCVSSTTRDYAIFSSLRSSYQLWLLNYPWLRHLRQFTLILSTVCPSLPVITPYSAFYAHRINCVSFITSDYAIFGSLLSSYQLCVLHYQWLRHLRQFTLIVSIVCPSLPVITPSSAVYAHRIELV